MNSANCKYELKKYDSFEKKVITFYVAFVLLIFVLISVISVS